MDSVAKSATFASPKKKPRHISIILTIWLAYLACLAILQLSGAGVGFKIWPIGEDRNWLYLLRSGDPQQTFQEFWALDHRNPMAAFWWIIASPLIRASDWGLHAISMIVSPFAAIMTYLVLDRLSRGRSQLFALITAILVLFWNFPARHDHVDRVMVIALIFTLATIYLYAVFVDGNRSRKGVLIGAVLCYLVALATYTIQSGAIIAIPFLAFFRLTRPIKNRLLMAVIDSAIFFAVFVGYTVTWMHFAGPSSGTGFEFHAREFISNVGASLAAFAIPPSNGQFIDIAAAEFSPTERRAWFLFAAICAMVVVAWAFISSKAAPKLPPLGWVVVLLLAIGLPTVFVEAGNSSWGPGARSIMILQVWEPVVLASIIFIIAAPIRNAFAKNLLAFVASSAVIAVMFFSTIGFNHFQSDVTFYQRNLAIGLRAIDDGQTKPMSYLVKIHNPVSGKVGTEPTLASYAPTILGRNETSLRLFISYPSPIPSYDPIWRIEFSDQGVRNGRGFFDATIVPYENLKVVLFDGLKVWVPPIITQDDLKGLQVDWKKSSPIVQ
ncbi:hypothetical protein HX890_14915 [Pseudomonas gingeri]|uniref:hypothetical protein n=1 Tax=Pseudomonas gingeri TaxID=117681 RepID=UPI0015A495F0|nr:hypothetical protein [Pseudomonas gingeri]NWD75404.1 hypothetical protein [Pseudomonas gingeri]